MLTKPAYEQDLRFIIARYKREGYKREDFDAVDREAPGLQGPSGTIIVTYRRTGIQRIYQIDSDRKWNEDLSLDLEEGIFLNGCAAPRPNNETAPLKV